MILQRASLLLLSSMLLACSANDPHRGAKTGALVGGATGALVGQQLGGRKGRFIGAAAGAIAGGLIGRFMDEQQQTLEKQLGQEQQEHKLEIERMPDDTLKLGLQNEVTFEFDSARLKPDLEPSLKKLAKVLKEYRQSVAHVVGFSDDQGSSEYNRLLSQRRAESIAAYLESQGVEAARIRTEGRGELEPRESNETEAGRRRNRRVEIYIRPIVQGKEAMAYERPRY